MVSKIVVETPVKDRLGPGKKSLLAADLEDSLVGYIL